MDSRLRNNYFIVVKTLCVLALALGGTMDHLNDTSKAGLTFLASALFLFFAIMPEIDNKVQKRKIIWSLGEGAAAVFALFLFPFIGVCFLTVTYLDLVSELDAVFYSGVFCLLLLKLFFEINIGTCILVMMFLILLYYQQNKIVSWYEKVSKDNIVQESKLKSDIEHTKIEHKDELNKSRLMHENELLEEKGRISQALHDKLGHSINGSIFKLEAAKVLINKEPEKSETILQEVIDNLRGSMDEIRVIIRNERPDKKRMALKSLQALLNECEEEYNIKTSLEIKQDDRSIPENIWEIILDNAFEAVTNALKYSNCTEISISINVLGEVVRATIKDNGKGAMGGIEEGMGIQGMKDRVRKVKGYIDIESMGGFTINMILPITKENKEADNGTDQSSDS
ncbi:MAG: hypothetical protein J5883_07345 [Clostridiales bacterium]|nr:hypothetical protein [Clostridiales bacterium]